MSIRLMTISDYEQVYALWHRTPGIGLRSLDDSQQGIERFLERNPHTCFVVEENGVVAGSVLGGHDGRRGALYHLAVDEPSQRKGLGKALVEAVLEALKQQGINRVGLLAFANNEGGNAFWEACGFTVRPDLVYRNAVLNKDNR